MDSPSAASFDEIRQVVGRFPKADEQAVARFWQRDAKLTKPPKSRARLEELGAWFVGWMAEYPAQMIHPRIAVFAGNHGVARQGVSAFPREVTTQMVENFRAGGAAINQLAMIHDSDLKVYDMALDLETRDFTEAPAMSEQECAEAIAFGMMDVTEEIDLLCVGEMGIGNSTSAATLAAALFGGRGADWAGRGTGVDDAGLNRKIAVIDQALDRHRDVVKRGDGLEILRHFGGLELSAIVGAVIAARMGRIPVLLDGFACTAAAAVLSRLDSTGLAHCQVGHLSKEPGHGKLCAALKKSPLLDFGMGLGEGTGAALAIGIVRAAIAMHNGMASFDEAGVSDKPEDGA